MRRVVDKVLPALILMVGFEIEVAAQGEHSDSPPKQNESSIFSIGAGIQHGFIFAHSPSVKNTKGAHPTGMEISFGWQRNDTSIWNLCHSFPKKGFFLSYYDFDAKFLGKGINTGFFLEPMYRLGKSTLISIKGAVGLAYFTNPFDSIHNPTNKSYSSHFNGYLSLGAGFWLRLNDHWWMNGSINFHHSSNGGIKEPNIGINYPTAGIAISYNVNPKPFCTSAGPRVKFWKDFTIRWDAGVFGAAKLVIDKYGNERKLPVIGIHVLGSKQIAPINALTIGAEVYADQALHQKLHRDSIASGAIKASLLIGHEFLLGKFRFSQELAFCVFNKTPYYDRIYHRWGILYQIDHHWGMGFNLQAQRDEADFIDLRVIYSWQKIGKSEDTRARRSALLN